MNYGLGATVAAGLLLLRAGRSLYRFWEESNPIIQGEKTAFAKDHNLNVDEALYARMKSMLEGGFREGDHIHLCFRAVTLRPGITYQHWFISNRNWILEFGGGQLSHNAVTVHSNPVGTYHIRGDPITIDDNMLQRMDQVLGATNYSLLLRNCEHVAFYVALGRWISFQSMGNNDLTRNVMEYMTAKENRGLRNVRPFELRKAEVRSDSFCKVNPGLQAPLEYSRTEFMLNPADTEAYNVVFIGPTNSGKSTIINLLFNRKVSKTGDSVEMDVDSVTREMTFFVGEGFVNVNGSLQRRRINLIDTVGFCDSALEPDEVVRLLQEQIRSNVMTIHRVVILTSGRIRKEEETSIKDMLKWLTYDGQQNLVSKPTNQCFVFVYTKCDGHSDERRKRNLASMCERLGLDTKILFNLSSPQLEREHRKVLDVGFPYGARVDDIKEDYDKLVTAIFPRRTHSPPIDMRPSMCLIM